MHRVEITKGFHFHAAHQLLNHRGLCSNPHGHTYKVEVRLRGMTTPENGEPDEGMVLDFDVLKAAWKDLCNPYLDHKNLNRSIGADIGPTTAENIARWIYSRLQHDEEIRPLLYDVRVWETDTSSARYPVKD